MVLLNILCTIVPLLIRFLPSNAIPLIGPDFRYTEIVKCSKLGPSGVATPFIRSLFHCTRGWPSGKGTTILIKTFIYCEL